MRTHYLQELNWKNWLLKRIWEWIQHVYGLEALLLLRWQSSQNLPTNKVIPIENSADFFAEAGQADPKSYMDPEYPKQSWKNKVG